MPRSLNATDTDLTADNLLRLPAEFGCPVWVYDAQIIRRQIAQLSQFDVVRFCAEGLLQYSYSASDARAGREGGFGVAWRDRTRAGGRLRSRAASGRYRLYRRSDRSCDP